MPMMQQAAIRVLFVTPVETASGETLTALSLADQVVLRGGRVLFLASTFATKLIGDRYARSVRTLGADGEENRKIWHSAKAELKPNVILFADYPLLFFSHGVSPLSNASGWVASLDRINARLVTLDHFGFAQQAIGMFMGPPHMSFHYVKVPPIPKAMEILLPCPMHEPLPVQGRRGTPIRYWEVPLEIPEKRRRDIRRRYLRHDDEALVFHPVPAWSWTMARRYGLPYYLFLPEILSYYLSAGPRPVTLVSVNDGTLLSQPEGAGIRIVNLPNLNRADFQDLLLSCDLMITENNASITLGRAVCGLVPSVVIHNSFRYRELISLLDGPLLRCVLEMESMRPGAIFPYHSFPTGTEELDRLGLYRDNSITGGFRQLELFGGVDTMESLHDLLVEGPARDRLGAAQSAYVHKLGSLDAGVELLERLAAETQ